MQYSNIGCKTTIRLYSNMINNALFQGSNVIALPNFEHKIKMSELMSQLLAANAGPNTAVAQPSIDPLTFIATYANYWVDKNRGLTGSGIGTVIDEETFRANVMHPDLSSLDENSMGVITIEGVDHTYVGGMAVEGGVDLFIDSSGPLLPPEMIGGSYSYTLLDTGPPDVDIEPGTVVNVWTDNNIDFNFLSCGTLSSSMQIPLSKNVISDLAHTNPPLFIMGYALPYNIKQKSAAAVFASIPGCVRISQYTDMIAEDDSGIGVVTGVSNTVVDASKNWSVNQWQGGYMSINPNNAWYGVFGNTSNSFESYLQSDPNPALQYWLTKRVYDKDVYDADNTIDFELIPGVPVIIEVSDDVLWSPELDV